MPFGQPRAHMQANIVFVLCSAFSMRLTAAAPANSISTARAEAAPQLSAAVVWLRHGKPHLATTPIRLPEGRVCSYRCSCMLSTRCDGGVKPQDWMPQHADTDVPKRPPAALLRKRSKTSSHEPFIINTAKIEQYHLRQITKDTMWQGKYDGRIWTAFIGHNT
jgi:hypothetical protein